MAKRDGKTITLGSGKLYLQAFASTMPTVDTLCIDDNILGYVKSGATLTYSTETQSVEDDLGLVKKIIVTKEDAVLKAGILTWNGQTIKKLIDRCGVTEAAGKRTTKIGGAGNAQGGYYAIGFKHEDATDGNVWIMLKGQNTAGLELTFATEDGTVLNPEFTAFPHDTNGTLIELIEEIPTTGGGSGD